MKTEMRLLACVCSKGKRAHVGELYIVYACEGEMRESQLLKKLVENAALEVGVLSRVHT